jgi:phenylalanyl-tRNA synthetase alpha subunit
VTTQFRPSSYPFTAPEVNPATIRRWKIKTKTMIGTVITIAPAAIEPVGSSNCELPVKFAIATGSVI